MSWSNEQTNFLIDEYAKYPCLYVVKHRDYHNKHLRSLALQKIVEAIKSMRPQVNEQEVLRKFLGLRSTYSTERKKVLGSLRSGMSEDEVYKPALWYYNRMDFLNEHLSLRTSKSSLEVPIATGHGTQAGTQLELDIDVDAIEGDYDLRDASLVLMSPTDASGSETSSRIQSPSPVATTSSGKVKDRRRKKKQEDDVEILGAVSKRLSVVAGMMQTSSAEVSRSSEDVFGEFVAVQLKKIKNEELKSDVQYQIHGLLRNALNSNNM